MPGLDRDHATVVARTAERASLQAFVEITGLTNELDVVRHNPTIAAEHSPALRQLLVRAGQHPSAGARQAWAE